LEFIMKKLFGILMIVLLTFAFLPFAEGTASAFEPGGQVRVEAGIVTGSDVTKANFGNTQVRTELRLDPHRWLRVEAVGTTGWNEGSYSKVFDVEEVGVLAMPIRGKNLDLGCGAKTGAMIDGNSSLSFRSSDRYWFGCLTEIKF
jgi:hypothetical protein